MKESDNYREVLLGEVSDGTPFWFPREDPRADEPSHKVSGVGPRGAVGVKDRLNPYATNYYPGQWRVFVVNN